MLRGERSSDSEGVARACGAIGAYEPALAASLAEAVGAPVREAHRDPRAVLFLDRLPSRWRGERGESGLGWCERMPDRFATARSWTAAARTGPGLVIDGDARALHGSASGVAAVYWMRSGNAVYFATSVDALARAGLGSLTPDWDAWASILLVSHPYEGRTPFAEIRRLRPLGRIETTGSGVTVTAGYLDWADAPPPAGDPAEAIAESLRAQTEALEPLGPIGCPLTAGWDSRALACVLAERGLARDTFTVNADRGDADEELLAAEVARELGLTHRVVEVRGDDPAAELAAAAHAVDYQTFLHLHMHHLVRGTPAGGIWADGIAGDIVIKGLHLTPEIVSAPDSTAAADLVFRRFAPERLKGVLRRRAWNAIRAPAHAAFLREAEPFSDHVGSFALTLWWARSHRLVGVSPGRIIGAEHELFMPFLDRDLAAAALAVPPRSKLGGSLYRAVLELLNPKVAALPSSNDGAERRGTQPSRIRSPAGRAARLALLERSPLRRWFSPRLERAIEEHDLTGVDNRALTMRRVEALCTFTLWCEAYRDLVGDPDPSELFS